MDQPKQRKPGSLLKRAFFNQYNFILLGSASLYALATQSWLPVVVGIGVETLWLVLGSDSKLFRRWVDRQDDKEALVRQAKEMNDLVNALDADYQQRFSALRAQAGEIAALAQENQGLEALLIRDEMAKVGQLLHSFLRMATMHQRLRHFLSDNPGSDIERDIARAHRALKGEADPRVQASYKQALSLAQKRLAQHDQIDGAHKALGVQMDTLEKAFGYLKSHIVGIGSREELAKELDGLVLGVSSVAEIETETDEALADLRGGEAARARAAEAARAAGASSVAKSGR